MYTTVVTITDDTLPTKLTFHECTHTIVVIDESSLTRLFTYYWCYCLHRLSFIHECTHNLRHYRWPHFTKSYDDANPACLNSHTSSSLLTHNCRYLRHREATLKLAKSYNVALYVIAVARILSGKKWVALTDLKVQEHYPWPSPSLFYWLLFTQQK